MTTPKAMSLDDLVEHFAECIGSPWGEGATYEPDRPMRAKEEGLDKASHLGHADKTAFKKDLKAAISKWADEQRVDELTKLKDMYENYSPKPGQLTAESFGSAGAGMERQGLINYCKDRIATLTGKEPSPELGEKKGKL